MFTSTFDYSVYFLKYSEQVKSHNYVVTFLPHFQSVDPKFDYGQLYLDFGYDF